MAQKSKMTKLAVQVLVSASALLSACGNSSGGSTPAAASPAFPASIPADLKMAAPQSKALNPTVQLAIVSLLNQYADQFSEAANLIPQNNESTDEKAQRLAKLKGASANGTALLSILQQNSICTISPQVSQQTGAISLAVGASNTEQMSSSIAGANCPLNYVETDSSVNTIAELNPQSGGTEVMVTNVKTTMSSTMTVQDPALAKAGNTQKDIRQLNCLIRGESTVGGPGDMKLYGKCTGTESRTLKDGLNLQANVEAEVLQSAKNLQKAKMVESFSFQGVECKLTILTVRGAIGKTVQVFLNGADITNQMIDPGSLGL